MSLSKGIFDIEVKGICKRYKIEPVQVINIIDKNIIKYPNLIKRITERRAGEDITRFKEYKIFIKDIKKQIYYTLRQYHKDKNCEINLKTKLGELISTSAPADDINRVILELMSTHVSTQERIPYYDSFYKKLFDVIEAPNSIIDIGCGLHPLSYPFEKQKANLKTYLAIDKDPSVINTLKIFAPYVLPIELIPVCIDINEITWTTYITNMDKFDFAFMLKLIPVVFRHSENLFIKLTEVPARQIQITGNIEAMTRKDKIMRREEKILKKFINISGKTVVDSFNNENEFGFIIG
ncbi:MAG: hypothetical protein HQK76_03450 [Desulfobacterales bacterium]|nr:hypothetical protein [Desulfobacterales bacterium]